MNSAGNIEFARGQRKTNAEKVDGWKQNGKDRADALHSLGCLVNHWRASRGRVVGQKGSGTAMFQAGA